MEEKGLQMLEGNFTLDELKSYRCKEIDIKTGELISNGFTYQSKQFSLSQSAQANLLGLEISKDDPAITYPITYNTIDDIDTYDVVDSADIHSMYLTALGTKKGVIDSGTALKSQIRAATTIDEVNSVIDNR